MKRRFLTMAVVIAACLTIASSATLAAQQSIVGSQNPNQMAVDGQDDCVPPPG
ncbi:MAG: hypothetical protein ABFQ53_04115 [Patescibacteria group bacterium]